MKLLSFKNWWIIRESKQYSSAIFTFGRFSIPTIGHKLLLTNIKEMADKNGADAFVFPSLKIEKDKLQTPFSLSEKVSLLKKIAPKGLTIVKDTNIVSMSQAITWLGEKGYNNIIMIVGSDGMKGAEAVSKEKLTAELKKVNPNAKLQLMQAGSERTGSGKGVQAASSSAARDAFKAGDRKKFDQIVPPEISQIVWDTLEKRVK